MYVQTAEQGKPFVQKVMEWWLSFVGVLCSITVVIYLTIIKFFVSVSRAFEQYTLCEVIGKCIGSQAFQQTDYILTFVTHASL